jgi:hypothetical protein
MVFEEHDLDPFERKQKQWLSTLMSDCLNDVFVQKKTFILFACGTAYFEQCLFSHMWTQAHFVFIEDPLIIEYKEAQLHSLNIRADIVRGTLDDMSDFFQHLDDLSDCLFFSLNPNIYEPFHLWNDMLNVFPVDYLLVSWPYMGKYGMPCLWTSSHVTTLSCPYGTYCQQDDFFIHSGLHDQYISATRHSLSKLL